MQLIMLCNFEGLNLFPSNGFVTLAKFNIFSYKTKQKL